MKYHYQEPTEYDGVYGELYLCNHPVYSRCTLYLEGSRGLAVIQQRFDPIRKITWWTEIDSALRDELYLHPRFAEFFEMKASEANPDGLYPTVTIRQIMWALRMKPLPKRDWETVFDRNYI
jgi:hypothetical protein